MSEPARFFLRNALRLVHTRCGGKSWDAVWLLVDPCKRRTRVTTAAARPTCQQHTRLPRIKMFRVLFLGVWAVFGASAASSCLDPADTADSCEVSSSGWLELSCDIADEDVDGGDVASCLDNAGRELVKTLFLDSNDFTTLPAGIFEGLTNLTTLYLHENALTTLPAGIFEGLALEYLFLYGNDFTTLPAGIFEGLASLDTVWLSSNALTTLPAGIFEGLASLDTVTGAIGSRMSWTLQPRAKFFFHACERRLCTSAGANSASRVLRFLDGGRYLHDNALTTLPAGIFEGLALEYLSLDGNDLECLPIIPETLEELDDDASFYADGLHVDEYGEECGCSAANVTDVCGAEICTPGPVGYTCDPAVPTPAPAPVLPATTAPEGPSLVATPSPSSGIAQGPDQDSDSTPIIAGVVSAVVVAALIALAVFLRKRRSRQKTTDTPAVPSARENGDIEREQNPDFFPPASAPLAVSSFNASPHEHPPAVPPSAPAPLGDEEPPAYQDVASSHRHTPADVNDGGGMKMRSGPGAAGEEDAAKKSSETAIATVSTANMSTAEQEEVAQLRQRQRAADAVAGGTTPGEALGGDTGGTAASSSASRRGSGSDIGLGQAVLAAAQELARSCQIPGVSEAAGVLCIMANLFTDSRDIDQASKSRLRQCRSIVLALTRADKVVAKGGATMGEAARVLLEDVHDAIFDLVELIMAFQSKNKLSKLLLSTLFKRRQDELDAVVDRAIMRLQLGLQLQTGQDVSAVKDNFDCVREGMDLYQRSMAEATSESVAEARRIKRQRKLDQVEIPEEHLFITDDLLGKGGFGEVYLADYNGHNAAAKVLYIGHDLGALDENQKQRETRQRRAFLRELEAMIRLRSPNTVNVFGAVTCLPDRMVLVMELLPNGDLLTLLKKSKKPLPEKQARRIIGDICAGMAFLHSKNTVHGDLKSANVLLDGDDRAKIADFGTSRWTQSTNTTGLATYNTKSNQNTQMSIAWSAPEVLEAEGSSYESDVYSFGIVVWEVLSRELPWAKKTRPRDILTAVWRGDRPSFPVDAPADIVDIAKACWCAEPKERTTFSAIQEGMKAEEWSDE
ncbi:unnamed protein product [Pylaiella littoralis]